MGGGGPILREIEDESNGRVGFSSALRLSYNATTLWHLSCLRNRWKTLDTWSRAAAAEEPLLFEWFSPSDQPPAGGWAIVVGVDVKILIGLFRFRKCSIYLVEHLIIALEYILYLSLAKVSMLASDIHIHIHVFHSCCRARPGGGGMYRLITQLTDTKY